MSQICFLRDSNIMKLCYDELKNSDTILMSMRNTSNSYLNLFIMILNNDTFDNDTNNDIKHLYSEM